MGDSTGGAKWKLEKQDFDEHLCFSFVMKLPVIIFLFVQFRSQGICRYIVEVSVGCGVFRVWYPPQVLPSYMLEAGFVSVFQSRYKL